ncbi:MAG: hypothetical protein C0513_00770 [Isosphaera sp.]|nr:hypothetical protein [Isosphaera sp.]
MERRMDRQIGLASRGAQGAGGARRGYSLVEVLVVIFIISILSSLILVAMRNALGLGRASAEQQFLRSIGAGLEAFESRFGFYPPLVNDADPLVALSVGLARPRLLSEDPAAQTDARARAARHDEFLRWVEDGPQQTVPRRSARTLTFYLMGLLPREIDGAGSVGLGGSSEGVFSFTEPQRDGGFTRQGQPVTPLVDLRGRQERLRVAGTQQGAIDRNEDSVLLDRWGGPIYVYYWAPVPHMATPPASYHYPGAPANDTARAGEVRSYNMPAFLPDPVENVEVRGARFAVVSAGPDGQINELVRQAPENADNVVYIGGRP